MFFDRIYSKVLDLAKALPSISCWVCPLHSFVFKSDLFQISLTWLNFFFSLSKHERCLNTLSIVLYRQNLSFYQLFYFITINWFKAYLKIESESVMKCIKIIFMVLAQMYIQSTLTEKLSIAKTLKSIRVIVFKSSRRYWKRWHFPTSA